MWPFKPKQPRLSMEEYAAQQPPAPCGFQTTHYEWEHFQSMGCPKCSAIRKREREDLERGLLAIAIVAEMEKRGLLFKATYGVGLMHGETFPRKPPIDGGRGSE